MGGTSALGSIYYVRGNREDYDNWDRVGNPGWSYKDVLPYFKKSENNMDPDVSSILSNSFPIISASQYLNLAIVFCFLPFLYLYYISVICLS